MQKIRGYENQVIEGEILTSIFCERIPSRIFIPIQILMCQIDWILHFSDLYKLSAFWELSNSREVVYKFTIS